MAVLVVERGVVRVFFDGSKSIPFSWKLPGVRLIMRYLFRHPVIFLFAIGLVVIAALVTRPLWHFPHPDRAASSDLMRWIALRDVSRYPRDLQISLVDNLEARVAPTELEGSNRSTVWAASYADQVRRNAELLTRVWFETRCERYCECSEGDRLKYLRRNIQVLLDWSEALEGTRDWAQEGAGFLDAFIRDVRDWTASAPSQLGEVMRSAVHDGIICWLATRDLALETPESQRTMARALHGELANSVESATRLTLALDPQQQSCLARNAMVLAKAWLQEQAIAYEQASPEGQRRLIDECLETLHAVGSGGYLSSSPDGSSTEFLSAMSEITTWIASVDPESRPRLSTFVERLQAGAMARWLRHVWQGRRSP